MKESEKIQQEIDNLKDEDDPEGFKMLNLSKKLTRAKRAEKAEAFKERLIAKGFEVTTGHAAGCITIRPTDFGILDFYPKANKVLIRTSNKWITDGKQWLTIKLLK